MAGCDVLVTGAGGFVGRHLVSLARDAGISVRAALGDLRQPSVAEEVIAATEPRAVVHLAASARGHDPWVALVDDLAMTGAVLRAVGRHAPGAPVLVPGSAAQYGLGTGRRLTEDDPTIPVSGYGSAKCVLERAVTSAPLSGVVRVIFARSFNHIGPGQGADAPAGQWVRQLVDAEQAGGGGVMRTGDLDAVRDFLDVRDVADAYLSLVRSPAEGVVNVCSGIPVVMRVVAEELARGSTVPVSIELDGTLTRDLDPPYIVGDPSRLQGLTGWSPGIPLQQSLTNMLAAYRRIVTTQSVDTTEGAG